MSRKVTNSAWQKIKQHWRSIVVVAIALVVVIVLIFVGYWFDWTGFARKTLWDWLQLLAALAVPVVLTFWCSLVHCKANPSQ